MRSVNESADKWFHSAFYCIQASGARIQDCDVKIIKKFMKNNYKISVVLTKADLVTEEEEELLRKELEKQINGISVIAVCNEGKKHELELPSHLASIKLKNKHSVISLIR